MIRRIVNTNTTPPHEIVRMKLPHKILNKEIYLSVFLCVALNITICHL